MRKYFVLATALLCCAVPWVGAGDQEKQAVAAIEKMGWQVKRASAKADAPVVGLLVKSRNIQGDDLKHVASLKDLEYVIFFTVTVKGEGLKHLKDLKKLHTLSLGFTTFPSEKTWDDLKELKQLKQVGVWYTTIGEKRDPRKEIQEALPKVKIIGPLLDVPTKTPELEEAK